MTYPQYLGGNDGLRFVLQERVMVAREQVATNRLPAPVAIRFAIGFGAAAIAALLVFGAYYVWSTSVEADARKERIERADSALQAARDWIRSGQFCEAGDALAQVVAALDTLASRSSEEDETLKAARQLATFYKPRIEAARIARREREDRSRRDAQRQQQLAAEALRHERQAELVAEKAKEMYPGYKQAAEAVADEILRLISATEVGISYVDYIEKLQSLHFAQNKFSMTHREQYESYASFGALTAAIGHFDAAKDAWKNKIDRGEKLSEDAIQLSWLLASDSYKAAMAALAEGE